VLQAKVSNLCSYRLVGFDIGAVLAAILSRWLGSLSSLIPQLMSTVRLNVFHWELRGPVPQPSWLSAQPCKSRATFEVVGVKLPLTAGFPDRLQCEQDFPRPDLHFSLFSQNTAIIILNPSRI